MPYISIDPRSEHGRYGTAYHAIPPHIPGKQSLPSYHGDPHDRRGAAHCSMPFALVFGLSCIVAGALVGAGIYAVSNAVDRAVVEGSSRLDPALAAAIPAVESARQILGKVDHASTSAEALLNRTVLAAAAALPAVERAAAMMNTTTQLMERFNQLARKPSLRIDLAPDAGGLGDQLMAGVVG